MKTLMLETLTLLHTQLKTQVTFLHLIFKTGSNAISEQQTLKEMPDVEVEAYLATILTSVHMSFVSKTSFLMFLNNV